MKIAILGTGAVGQTLGTKLAAGGHEVRMGSRTADNPKAKAWAEGAEAAGEGASHGTFADAADFGEVVFNCTGGAVSLEALALAGEANLAGKVLVDVANPLDFSHGMPPSLSVCNTDSLAEQIQRAYPEARVVKALNTMNCSVMVAPETVPGAHDLFYCGDDAEAKRRVADLIVESLGWPRASLVDLGDLTAARGMEMILPIWLRLWDAFGTSTINFHIAVGEGKRA